MIDVGNYGRAVEKVYGAYESSIAALNKDIKSKSKQIKKLRRKNRKLACKVFSLENPISQNVLEVSDE